MEKVKKQQIRERIWKLMEEENVTQFPKPVFGRIPNFKGAKAAVMNFCTTNEYNDSNTIFANPDSPQHPFRKKALYDGKTVIMATPGIKKGFLELDPEKIPKDKLKFASTIKGSFNWGTPIPPSNLQIDLFMAGSVAVSKEGGRLGKGEGYTDLEYESLKEYNAFSKEIIVTIVHEIQVLETVPMKTHDRPLDIIVTPSRIIRTETNYEHPRGIQWDLISKKKIRKIPLLHELKGAREGEPPHS